MTDEDYIVQISSCCDSADVLLVDPEIVAFPRAIFWVVHRPA